MNVLDYRTSELNGLSFELLVDGQPLGELVGSWDTEIPYYFISDDLPYYPPIGEDHDSEFRIISLCHCGEFGCGHTKCRVIKGEDTVVFRDFDVNTTSVEGSRRVFEFPRSNYDAVVADIVQKASAYASNSGAAPVR
jgi:hypothetical protein